MRIILEYSAFEHALIVTGSERQALDTVYRWNPDAGRDERAALRWAVRRIRTQHDAQEASA